jgi:hypothetical protein
LSFFERIGKELFEKITTDKSLENIFTFQNGERMAGSTEANTSHQGIAQIYRRTIEFSNVVWWLGLFVGGVGIGADDIHGDLVATLVVTISVLGLIVSLKNFIRKNKAAFLIETISYFVNAVLFVIAIFLAQTNWGELTVPYALLALFCLAMGTYRIYKYRKM